MSWLHRTVGVMSVLSLCACRPSPPPTAEPTTEPAPPARAEPAPKPEPTVDTERNSAEAVLASVDRITHIELGERDRVMMRFDDDIQAQIVEALRETELADGLSATTPPWPGFYVFIHVEGRALPYVASITGGGMLRVNAAEPYGLSIADAEGVPDFANIHDIGYCEAMMDAAREHLGSPTSKEYSRKPKPPLRSSIED